MGYNGNRKSTNPVTPRFSLMSQVADMGDLESKRNRDQAGTLPDSPSCGKQRGSSLLSLAIAAKFAWQVC